MQKKECISIKPLSEGKTATVQLPLSSQLNMSDTVQVETEASEHDMELSSVNDNSTDFLSEEELTYYFSLEEL